MTKTKPALKSARKMPPIAKRPVHRTPRVNSKQRPKCSTCCAGPHVRRFQSSRRPPAGSRPRVRRRIVRKKPGLTLRSEKPSVS
jgi:hypothetical protein